jgi:hypothetical protein
MRIASHIVALSLTVSGAAAAQPVAPAEATPSPSAAPEAAAAEPAPAKFTTYVVGLRLKFAEGPNGTTSAKLRPTLGFHYGRWKIGTNSDVDGWLAFSGFRKEPTVAYELSASERLSTSLSLRVHNLGTGESFDAFETGRHTLRGRILLGYQLDQRWAMGAEVTQDLLGRGDGTTLGLGLSRSIPLSEYGLLSASAGLTWGSGVHWRTANAKAPLASTLHAGFGSLGVGLGYRYAFSPAWAWYANVGASRPVGQLSRINAATSASTWSTGGQIGLLYFGKF